MENASFMFGDLPAYQLPTLGATWIIFGTEPEMDDIAEKGGDFLKEVQAELKIFPFQYKGEDRIFLARFEFKKYDKELQHPEAIIPDDQALDLAGSRGVPSPDTDGEVVGWVDFISGIPVDCIEKLVAIGAVSSMPDAGIMGGVIEIKGKESQGSVPPFPEDIFGWPDTDRILLNLTALPTQKRAATFMPPLAAPEASKHWWFRVNFRKNQQQWPVPGEFLGLGVLMLPGDYWGTQKSSPFIYSGNWMDTLYYTNAVVKRVIEPTESIPYPTYEVQWRKFGGAKDGTIVVATPSDFAEYKVKDSVCVLKDVTTEKISQLWEDDDMETNVKEFDKNKAKRWVIVPISFYGRGFVPGE